MVKRLLIVLLESKPIECNRGVVVITSASHAEGRGFNSHQLYTFYVLKSIKIKMSKFSIF